jgi:hypothetical protein
VRKLGDHKGRPYSWQASITKKSRGPMSHNAIHLVMSLGNGP